LLATIEQEGLQEKVSSVPAENETGMDTKVVFAFDEPNGAPQWFTLNDDVMGGVSDSAYERIGEGTGLFRGVLSLENNGGFATIRSVARDLELEGWDGVVVRVRGDGRTYKFSALPSDRRWEVNTWGRRFETRAGEWQEIKLPFADLAHTVMGRVVRGSARIPPRRIRSLSLSISDKNETPFRLEIDSIAAYRESGRAVASD
jgi:monofunctional biosynthetic peptidoglycan transglycosylase